MWQRPLPIAFESKRPFLAEKDQPLEGKRELSSSAVIFGAVDPVEKIAIPKSSAPVDLARGLNEFATDRSWFNALVLFFEVLEGRTATIDGIEFLVRERALFGMMLSADFLGLGIGEAYPLLFGHPGKVFDGFRLFRFFG
jgi:hypothetical protein